MFRATWSSSLSVEFYTMLWIRIIQRVGSGSDFSKGWDPCAQHRNAVCSNKESANSVKFYTIIWIRIIQRVGPGSDFSQGWIPHQRQRNAVCSNQESTSSVEFYIIDLYPIFSKDGFRINGRKMRFAQIRNLLALWNSISLIWNRIIQRVGPGSDFSRGRNPHPRHRNAVCSN